MPWIALALASLGLAACHVLLGPWPAVGVFVAGGLLAGYLVGRER